MLPARLLREFSIASPASAPAVAETEAPAGPGIPLYVKAPCRRARVIPASVSTRPPVSRAIDNGGVVHIGVGITSLLREVVLPAMRVSVAQAAREIGVSRQHLYKILSGGRAITAEKAFRLGKYCGNGPELWLNMQSAYDLWHAQRSLADELKDIPTRAAI